MNKPTRKQLNREIARRYPELDIELVKGAGYFWFNGDDGIRIESIYVPHIISMTVEQWIDAIVTNVEQYLTTKGE